MADRGDQRPGAGQRTSGRGQRAVEIGRHPPRAGAQRNGCLREVGPGDVRPPALDDRYGHVVWRSHGNRSQARRRYRGPDTGAADDEDGCAGGKLVAQQGRSSHRRCHDFVLGRVDALGAESRNNVGRSMCRVVGHEADANADPPDFRNCFDGARHRLVPEVDDAIQVDENGVELRDERRSVAAPRRRDAHSRSRAARA